MSQKNMGIERGIRLYQDASDNSVDIITGDSAPTGLGQQSDAAIGSLYIRNGSGEMYQKKTNTASAGDYIDISSGGTIGTFRPEQVIAVTGDTGVTPGVARNLTTTPFSDDEGTQLVATDFQVGQFLIADDVFLEVTNVTAPSITFSSPSYTPVLDDTFHCRNYLKDTPQDQEGQALVAYNGALFVKIADLDFAFADGIGIAAGYTAASGDPSSADTVQSALEKVDGNNDAQDLLLGTSQGDVDLGTFPGGIIADNASVKTALQEVEAFAEETDLNVDDLITLSGMPENSQDLGTFTGAVITDNSTVKEALQELESKDEAQDIVVAEIDQNVNDLITLSGVAENSTNLGAFTGFGSILLTATETVKTAIQKITDFLGQLRMAEATGITTQVAVDLVPVANYAGVKWVVVVFEEATPANRIQVTIDALNDGTLVDHTSYGKIKLANFDYDLDVDISGGNMRLLATSGTAGVTVRARRIGVYNA